MKKLLSIAVILISLSISAQGNLQFNQVINSEYTFTGSPDNVIGTITVPNGKVLKIEGVSLLRVFGSSEYPIYSSYAAVTIAGINVYYSYSQQNTCLPLWLGEGTHNIVVTQTGNTTSNKVGVSAIEFNVVP
ncbi:MAG: hypothetical protein P8O07_00690 [Crocinitomicaceae bacterium]|nr:hypothetical protein [Crocinitomicaceae bacterium]